MYTFKLLKYIDSITLVKQTQWKINMNSNYLIIFNACDSDNNSSAQENPVADVTTAECPCFSAKSLEMYLVQTAAQIQNLLALMAPTTLILLLSGSIQITTNLMYRLYVLTERLEQIIVIVILVA